MAKSCDRCRAGGRQAFPVEMTMAFQPIFEARTGRLFAQEALLRGKDGSGAGEIFAALTDENLYLFDQTCRVTAIGLAARLGLSARLSINFMPNAVYEPEACIRRTLVAARAAGIANDRLIFEFTEAERVRDKAHLVRIVEAYREMGFLTAIDDFGAGHAGLSLLADVVPDIVKVDRDIVAGLGQCRVRRAILARILDLSADLGFMVLAEGIEDRAGLDAALDLGVDLVQGYFLGRPEFEGFVETPAGGLGPAGQPAVCALAT